MSYSDHAMREFKAAGWIDENGKYTDSMQQLMCEQILELLKVFSEHGHSGFSANYAIELFEKLAKFEPLVPLTGKDFEWVEVNPGLFQNNRCSHVFKDTTRFNGQAYDIEGIIFWEWYTDSDGEKYKTHFTNGDSHVPITFPYVPVREYKERIKE